MGGRVGLTYCFAAVLQDEGPAGIFVDMQGHDKNDGVVGTVYYNNQTSNSVHITSIYVHGKNITTQGRIPIDLDIEVSEKKKLVDIMREKLGEPATVSVDVHYND
jgi:hypothetical protein